MYFNWKVFYVGRKFSRDHVLARLVLHCVGKVECIVDGVVCNVWTGVDHF